MCDHLLCSCNMKTSDGNTTKCRTSSKNVSSAASLQLSSCSVHVCLSMGYLVRSMLHATVVVILKKKHKVIHEHSADHLRGQRFIEVHLFGCFSLKRSLEAVNNEKIQPRPKRGALTAVSLLNKDFYFYFRNNSFHTLRHMTHRCCSSVYGAVSDGRYSVSIPKLDFCWKAVCVVPTLNLKIIYQTSSTLQVK